MLDYRFCFYKVLVLLCVFNLFICIIPLYTIFGIVTDIKYPSKSIGYVVFVGIKLFVR